MLKPFIIFAQHQERKYMRNKRIALFILCTTICALPSCTGFGNSSSRSNSVNAYAPVFSADGKTVKYGYYPQTHVNDSLLIQELNEIETPESNGWYLYDGTYYAKLTANPRGVSENGVFRSLSEFEDGITIISGREYWFRCELIKWKILSSNHGVYSLVSSKLLDVHAYGPALPPEGETAYPVNWIYYYNVSGIRSWLNDAFYNTAFNLEDSYIQTVTVDNSASSTSKLDNTSYFCENTEDKVYLLSYQDYLNTSYFLDNDAMCCKTTDWARATGTDYCGMINSGVSEFILYNAGYLTRSSGYYTDRFYDKRKNCWSISEYGGLQCDENSDGDNCVRPAITIKIS